MIQKSIYYCFNCGESKTGNIDIKRITQEICKCKQKSFKIGEFYAVKLVRNNDGNVRHFVAHKFGDPANDKYFVKPIYLPSNYIDLTVYESLQTRDIFTEKKQGKELEDIGKIKREKLDCIPSVEEVHYNESWIYVISQFIGGENLREKMTNKILDDTTILAIFKEIAVAVKKIHEKDIVHGDIKPENIIYTEENKIVIVDPVIAKDFGELRYIPKKDIAYFPPELSSIFDNQNSNTNYRMSLRKYHDLYSLSALFVKILSNSVNEDRYFRNDAEKWHWDIDLNELKNSKKLNALKISLSHLVDEPEFRKEKNVDELIKIIESLELPQANTILSKLSNTLNSCLEAVLSLPPVEFIANIYNRLPPLIRENKFVRWIVLIITIIVLGDWIYKTHKNWNSLPPESSGQTSFSTNERISNGEKILIRQEIQDQKNQYSAVLNSKQEGRRYFSERKYSEARESFRDALNAYQNAPETRIYYNNAAIGDRSAYSIAVVVRSNEKPQDSLKILRGVAQAQNEFNIQQNKKKDSNDSKPLKIVIVNDDDSEVIAERVARNIVDRKEILGVIGHYSSNSTIAASKVYNDGKLVAISATSTSDEITNLSPYVFRTVHKDSDAARILADYTVTKNKWHNVAVIWDSDSKYSESLKSAFIKNIESYHFTKIVDTIDISRDTKYIDKLQKLKNKNTQALMLALPGTKLSYLSSISKNKGEMNLLGGNDLYTIDLLKDMQELDRKKKSLENPNDMVLAVPWAIDKNKTTEFVQDSQKLWGGDVDWQTAMAYDATQAFIQAIETNPQATRETVKEALSNPKFIVKNGTNQKFQFNGRDRDNIVRLVQIKKSKESRSGTGYDFVEIP